MDKNLSPDTAHCSQQQEIETLKSANEELVQTITRQRERIQRLVHELNCYKGSIQKIQAEVVEQLKTVPFDEALTVPADGALPKKGEYPLFRERFDKTEDPRKFFYRIYKNYLEAGVQITYKTINDLDKILYRRMGKINSKPVYDPELISLVNQCSQLNKVLGDKITTDEIF